MRDGLGNLIKVGNPVKQTPDKTEKEVERKNFIHS